MQDITFLIFAVLTVLFGLMVVANPFSRNPVTSAMFLVLTIVSMAGLFIKLNAFFLAAVQILVYAGAVMVLFLFVIMLLDIREEERVKFRIFGIVTGLIAVGAILATAFRALHQSKVLSSVSDVKAIGGTKPLGKLLFTEYLLPFEILSILLLVAMIGVILLSKKELK